MIARPPGLWEQYIMALEEVTDRLERITKALGNAGIP
jgi:hypothetical protein